MFGSPEAVGQMYATRHRPASAQHAQDADPIRRASVVTSTIISTTRCSGDSVSQDALPRGPTVYAVYRDDSLLLLSHPVEMGTRTASSSPPGIKIQVTRWPENLVIAPDPPAPGTNRPPNLARLPLR
jgi:hypothetical protein